MGVGAAGGAGEGGGGGRDGEGGGGARRRDGGGATYLLVEDEGRPIEMGDMFRIARCEVQLFAVPTHGAPPVGTAA